MLAFFVFFKQKTAYEMRISDWSSDVCSSDLVIDMHLMPRGAQIFGRGQARGPRADDADRLAGRGARVQRFDPALGPSGVGDIFLDAARSERRRVGKECVSTCRSRW